MKLQMGNLDNNKIRALINLDTLLLNLDTLLLNLGTKPDPVYVGLCITVNCLGQTNLILRQFPMFLHIIVYKTPLSYGYAGAT
jgi:hypothetical protein